MNNETYQNKVKYKNYKQLHVYNIATVNIHQRQNIVDWLYYNSPENCGGELVDSEVPKVFIAVALKL